MTTIRDLLKAGTITMDTVVLGTLPMTADGVAVVPCVEVVLWCPVNYSDKSAGYTEECGHVRLFADGSFALTSKHSNQCWELERCYSTPEAADAAKGGA